MTRLQWYKMIGSIVSLAAEYDCTIESRITGKGEGNKVHLTMTDEDGRVGCKATISVWGNCKDRLVLRYQEADIDTLVSCPRAIFGLMYV